jgi:hypothetical protein
MAKYVDPDDVQALDPQLPIDAWRNYRRRFGATARLTGADRLTYSGVIGADDARPTD